MATESEADPTQEQAAAQSLPEETQVDPSQDVAQAAPDASGNIPINVKQGWSTKVTPGYTPSAPVQQELNQSFDQKQAAAKVLGDAEIEQAKQDAHYYDSYQKQQQALVQKQADERQAIADKTADETRKVDVAIKDFKNVDVNPDYYGTHGGTGERVADAIALAFGAFGAGINHTQNFAQQIVQSKIDTYIQGQKDQLSKAKDTVELENNQLARLMKQGLDLPQAQAALRKSLLDDLQTNLMANAAKYTSIPSAQAAAQRISAAISEDQAKTQMEIEKASKNKVESVSSTEMAPATVSPSAQKDEDARSVWLPEKLGGRVKAPSAEAGTKLRTATAVVQDMNTQLAKLEKTINQPGWESLPSSTKNHQIKGILSSLQGDFIRSQGFNRFSPGDNEIAAQQVGDPTKFYNRDNTVFSDIKAYRDRINKSYLQELRANGMLNQFGNQALKEDN